MKKHLTIAALCACCAISAPADTRDQTFIVKVTDFSRRAAFELLNPEEFQTLQRRIAEEKRFYRKAFDLAERAWDADKNNAGKPFPSAAISIRKASLIGRGYETREEARDKLIYYENKELRRRTSLQRKTEKKYMKLRRLRGLRKRDQLEEEVETNDREAVCDRARALYLAKLQGLLRDKTQPSATTQPSYAPAFTP